MGRRGGQDEGVGPLQTSESTAVTRYGVNIYWSEPDHCFIAEVPELAGCAADGATRQEALANAEVVIKEWLDTARELSRSLPEPTGRLLTS